MDMLGWSKHTGLKLFGNPEFPAVDFGKRKVVESQALIEYFSRRRIRDEESYSLLGKCDKENIPAGEGCIQNRRG